MGDGVAAPGQEERLASFLEVSVQLTQDLDAATVINVVIERAMEITAAGFGALVTFESNGTIDRFVSRGFTGEQTEMGAFMSVPLSLRGRVIGALYLAKTPEAPAFDRSDEEFVTSMGAMAAVGISNARLFKEEIERSRRTALMQQISWTVRHSLDITEVLSEAVEALGKAAGVDRCYIRLVDDDDQDELGPVEVEWDAPGVQPLNPARTSHYPIVTLTARTRLTQWSDDIRPDPRFTESGAVGVDSAGGAVIGASVGTPLEWGDELMGVVSFQKVTPHSWTSSEIALIENAAREVSVAIHHARLYYSALDKADKLRELDEMRSDFLAMVSHELRSPMTVISGIAHILRWKSDRLKPEAREELLNTLERESRRLARLVSEFLDLEAIERGKIELRSDDVDLAELAAEAMVDAGQSARATLEVNGEDCSVMADRDRVKQVLLNLLTNAAKFSHDGDPIDLSIEPAEDHVLIRVVDHGPGIRQEDMDRLFTPFSRLQTTVKQTSGSGVGLYVSKTIIEMHGGAIWVESQVGDGATFAFTLPR